MKILTPNLSIVAVRVLVDHGVREERIVFITYLAGRMGVKRLTRVFPSLKAVVGELVEDDEERWIEERYFGC